MPIQAADSWDWLRVLTLISAVVTPLLIFWLTVSSNERRRILAEKQQSIQETLETRLRNIEKQQTELRGEVREGRKECAENMRAFQAQISEYPRRREMQEADSELWRELRSRRGNT